MRGGAQLAKLERPDKAKLTDSKRQTSQRDAADPSALPRKPATVPAGVLRGDFDGKK